MSTFGKSHEEEMAKTKKWEFKSIDVCYIAGSGKAYTIKNPITCVDFSWLIGQEVLIDGVTQQIIGVELRRKKDLYAVGEEILALVRSSHIL